MEVRKLIYVSMFATIMGALGMVPPILLGFSPVPITLQTLGVMLAGSVLGVKLGPKYAALSQLLFMLLVAAGLPLLSGGRGGIGVFVTPSGGYLIGYIAAAYVIGWICCRMKEMTVFKTLAAHVIGGMIVVYLFGVPFQAMMMDISVREAAMLSLVYLPGDFTKAVVAALLAVRLQKALPVPKEVRV